MELAENPRLNLPELPDALTQQDRDFLEAVAHELVAARAKYPGNKDRVLALMGESGEVFHAIQLNIRGDAGVEKLREELPQLAAMACRLATEGDPMLRGVAFGDDNA